jgi:hypothetical protein
MFDAILIAVGIHLSNPQQHPATLYHRTVPTLQACEEAVKDLPRVTSDGYRVAWFCIKVDDMLEITSKT